MNPTVLTQNSQGNNKIYKGYKMKCIKNIIDFDKTISLSSDPVNNIIYVFIP